MSGGPVRGQDSFQMLEVVSELHRGIFMRGDGELDVKSQQCFSASSLKKRLLKSAIQRQNIFMILQLEDVWL